MALTKAQARKAKKIIEDLRKLVAQGDTLTDSVCDRGAATGSDDMHTYQWQNFQYAIDCVRAGVFSDLDGTLETFNDCIANGAE